MKTMKRRIFWKTVVMKAQNRKSGLDVSKHDRKRVKSNSVEQWRFSTDQWIQTKNECSILGNQQLRIYVYIFKVQIQSVQRLLLCWSYVNFEIRKFNNETTFQVARSFYQLFNEVLDQYWGEKRNISHIERKIKGNREIAYFGQSSNSGWWINCEKIEKRRTLYIATTDNRSRNGWKREIVWRSLNFKWSIEARQKLVQPNLCTDFEGTTWTRVTVEIDRQILNQGII